MKRVTRVPVLALCLLLPGLARAVDTRAVVPDGSLLLVADSDYGLRVLDRADPLAPGEIGDLALPGVLDVAVTGNLACLVDGTGLILVDLADPEAPDIAGSEIPGTPAWFVETNGTLAYVAGGHDLHVIDLADPSQPTVLGSVTLPLSEGGGIQAIAREGDVVYVASYRPVIGVVHAVDVANPAAPDVRDDRNVFGAFGIAVRAGVAYVSGANIVTVLDVSDPDAILTHTTVALRSGSGEVGEDAWFDDGHLLVSYRKGVVVYGLGDPTAPVEVASFGTEPGWANGGASIDGVTYVANGSGGLFVQAQSALEVPDTQVPPPGFALLGAGPGWMRLQLPARGAVDARLCDVAGRDRGTVFAGVLEAGDREIRWRSSSPLPSGIYFLRVESPWGAAAAPVVRID